MICFLYYGIIIEKKDQGILWKTYFKFLDKKCEQYYLDTILIKVKWGKIVNKSPFKPVQID